MYMWRGRAWEQREAIEKKPMALERNETKKKASLFLGCAPSLLGSENRIETTPKGEGEEVGTMNTCVTSPGWVSC